MERKKRKCKICKTSFSVKSNDHWYCDFDCAMAALKIQNDKKWKKEKAKRKEALKTTQDYVRELQVIFNKFIRLRDKGLNCISCNKPAKKENCGHYRSAGGNPELRFVELNCHLQCEYCNTYLHGNLIDYRINLIKKIGLDKVEWLEGKHEPRKYTIPELKALKIKYKEKIKML